MCKSVKLQEEKVKKNGKQLDKYLYCLKKRNKYFGGC